jgi:hypothetical protein
MCDAGPTERIAELQPARAATDDDDRVLAGWKGLLGQVRQLVACFSLRASARSIRNMTGG